MIGNFLRQVSKAQLMWSQCVQQWQRQGATVVHTIPSDPATLLTIRADTGWEAMLDLDAWFQFMMPAHGGLASSAFSRKQMETLFFGCDQPIDLGLAEFDYQQLTPAGQPGATLAQQHHYGLSTKHGVMWITKKSDNNNNSSFFSQNFPLDYLPMPLRFELGSSECRLAVVNKLRCGDVLLINEPEQCITLYGKRLGFYQRTGDEIMIEEDFLQPSFTEEESLLQVGSEDIDEGIRVSPRSLMPVQLTFTLQQATVTVQDLEALSQGHVFFCDPDAQKKVIVHGNGLALARGELIWIDDRLGVEVTGLYHEAGNGE